MRRSLVLRPWCRIVQSTVLAVAAATFAAHIGDRVAAESVAMRWDGLIEHITAASQWGDQQPNGPSQLSRHSVSADGRYVVFTSDATNLPGGWGPAVFIRDRHAGETRLLLGMPALRPVLSANRPHLA